MRTLRMRLHALRAFRGGTARSACNDVALGAGLAAYAFAYAAYTLLLMRTLRMCPHTQCCVCVWEQALLPTLLCGLATYAAPSMLRGNTYTCVRAFGDIHVCAPYTCIHVCTGVRA